MLNIITVSIKKLLAQYSMDYHTLMYCTITAVVNTIGTELNVSLWTWPALLFLCFLKPEVYKVNKHHIPLQLMMAV